jgi:hypothetical protein
MAAEPPPHLADLLNRLQFILSQPVDFAATDTENTLLTVRLLSMAATYFNTLIASRLRDLWSTAAQQGSDR